MCGLGFAYGSRQGVDGLSFTVERGECFGFVLQELALYQELSARENLAFFGRLSGIKGAELLSAVENALFVAGLQDRGHEAAAESRDRGITCSKP